MCWIIWDKGQRNFTLADCELAWTSFNKASRIFEYSRSKSNFLDDKIHICQKPIALYKWLLENYASQGDLILDTHVGSASSLIACEELGFNYVACELDKDYYNDACKRIQDYRNKKKNESMF